jgi:hypothetical protein
MEEERHPMEVTKKSRKPFKSGKKTETVVKETINPYSGKEAYLLEDGSVVNKSQCQEK